MLLWHGSRTSNFYNILSQGLRIAPPEVPSTGFMFGKGIYFADVASKSGNYCYPAKGKCALLMLSEVALGTPQILRDANYSADKLEQGKNSTLGLGKFRPSEGNFMTMKDKVRIPLGPLEDHSGDGTQYSLLYNEYVVYDVAQVKSRYLVEVKFDM
ncbi:Poly(ADP-ribose) polymerase catalytic domain protein [Teladorsagia circumcincta]|uniref:Poly [ADP-ribose] polymerase n=1 Tax=Teladorsagia circumcincta TaxID=45464 RepID=A0A2G9V3H9_TELCI|nr:Poly(ADP-ribose) polymerase catalytic domain protein [Teladorsagia circumcincta]